MPTTPPPVPGRAGPTGPAGPATPSAVLPGRGRPGTDLRRRDPDAPVRLDVSGQPVTRRRIRRTRRWMLLLLLTPACLIVLVAVTVGSKGPKEPVVHPAVTPAGYVPVTDAYFGYAVPKGYSENAAWTDQNGDFLYGTARAFVAETMQVTSHAPTASAKQPASLRDYGLDAPKPYRVGTWRPLHVAGAQAGWETTVTRPDGWKATLVDTWIKQTSTQVWIMVHAPAGVAGKVVASLHG